jgi:HAD superfamily hydrolase (TIGR01484 family)
MGLRSECRGPFRVTFKREKGSLVANDPGGKEGQVGTSGSMGRALLASDMDGTVIPLEEGARWERDVAELRRAVEERPDLLLAYVTGRDFPLAERGIARFQLPVPHLLVCDVGSSLYHLTPEGFRRDHEYGERMEEALGGLSLGDVRDVLDGVRGLTLQSLERQTSVKLSFYVAPGDDHAKVLGVVQERLEAFQGRVQTVYSVRARDGTGLLDVLPAGVAKDFALHYLHDHTGVDEDRLVFAGDSGNDVEAMLTGFKVVVVGNAPGDVKEELKRRATAEGIQERLYFAESPYARGVLEGCRHFGIL